ncbi:flagellar hook-basal body complex protein FliE [Lacisediminimonas sp.]|uniref:flagellar hook-basal body complex protein FliE n=1 Tax=Lacisediminimonas sp. TaxID=3060582 RepID=UPI002725101B|nr:flagellar hook-basal body complex protein FliE [Lacisediminimonas sp.]MDO8299544.1 flagellar hook-basal body complex protein FliE [Lacisediminimonas sp.]MDO9217645.1 flagellar hook-basal body complex protein FliE [Lacisediminimonas sp.]
MSISPVDFIAPGTGIAQLAGGSPAAAGIDFGAWLKTQVAELNTSIANSDIQALDLASGQASNLHQVMIGMEETKLAFQLAVQVRNRVLEAYQEVLRMQV